MDLKFSQYSMWLGYLHNTSKIIVCFRKDLNKNCALLNFPYIAILKTAWVCYFFLFFFFISHGVLSSSIVL